jgi:SAM-dependent methyltransferase
MAEQGLLIPGWIYDLADYRQIFDLSDADLGKRILDFPGGISSFNAEMREAAYSIVSGDPHYHVNLDAMSDLAEEILAQNEKDLREHVDRLKFKDEENLQTIFRNWSRNKDKFLADYTAGLREHRYQAMHLPKLPFKDFHFELALCSDLLFHAHARGGLSPQELMAELSRVALEVRIFPLLDEKNKMPQSIGPLLLEYQKLDFGIEVREVPYEIKQGGNAMLRVWSKQCAVPASGNHV